MCPGSFYELFYVTDFTKTYWIQTSGLPDFLSEVFRGEILSRDIVKKFLYFTLCWIHLHLTRNSFKDHMHTRFYILKEVFFHVLVFKKVFLVLMFKYAGSLLTRSFITISFKYLYYHKDINS